MVSSQSRQTKQQKAILEMLSDLDGFVSAQQLFEQIKTHEQAGSLTTTYRVLQNLEAQGLVDSLTGDNQQVLYRKCVGDAHHHHLVCTHCHTTVEISGNDVENFTSHAAAEHGFIHQRHTLEIFGICQKCQKISDIM